jgi:hemerythrin-like domain-containing protein
MQALDVLIEEHRHIIRVLDATEQVVLRARSAQYADAAYFQQLARFIEHFADGAHHAKEEEVLFRALEDFGLPSQGGPLHCMLAEHAMGRGLRAELDASSSALARGDKGALFDVLDASARYAELLRSHIRKEDMVLYPMAEQLLPAEAFETMLARYAEVTKVAAADFARAADELASWSFAGHEARV